MRYESGPNDIKIIRAPDAAEARKATAVLTDDVRRLVRSLRVVLEREYASDDVRRAVRERIVEELGK